MTFFMWDCWKKETNSRQLQDHPALLRTVSSIVVFRKPTCFVQFIIVCSSWNGTWEHLAELDCMAVTLTSARGQLYSLSAALLPLLGIDDRQFFLLAPWGAEALSLPFFLPQHGQWKSARIATTQSLQGWVLQGSWYSLPLWHQGAQSS